MTQIIYAIDPGITGGIVAVNTEGKILSGMRMPVTDFYNGKKQKKKIVHAFELMKFFADQEMFTSQQSQVIIERVHSMPAQGVTSAFSFGRAAGAAEAIAIASLGLSNVHWVEPRIWKQHFKLDSDKNKSQNLATEIFGGKHWSRKVDNGIAEAALIAIYFLDRIN